VQNRDANRGLLALGSYQAKKKTKEEKEEIKIKSCFAGS
jgi:hypothetical protein